MDGILAVHWVILGQGDVNWIELIVILVLFGGGILSAIAKKLITYFTPEEEQSSPTTPEGKRSTRPGPAGMPAGPKTPAGARRARAPGSPSIERPAPPGKRPVPSLPPVILLDMDEVAAPAPPRRQPTMPRAKPAKAPPVARPVPHSAAETTRPQRVRGLGNLDVDVIEEEEAFEAAAAERMVHLESSIPDADLAFDEGVEKRLGYEDTGPGPTQAAPLGTAVLTGQPSLSALRRAVLLREILGPPVALAPREDIF